MNNLELINKLEAEGILPHSEFVQLLSTFTQKDLEFARKLAREIATKYFGNKIYIRGLIEFTNICKQNCYYCGLRAENKNAERYRLTKDEILSCCETGYPLGFRTFVLQGGEDSHFDDDLMCDIVRCIKEKYPDCAVTLSIGEKSKMSYQKLFDAGADRFLLRHETANSEHYRMLHPKGQTLETRKKCLFDLKEIGFQTGCGFMVGSPYQTFDTLAEDLLFIRELNPEMVGIGPFIPHKDTPFGEKVAGSIELTLLLIALVRIMLKNVLLPSTTALGTIHKKGREMGILSGANVVMPNLSPIEDRQKYMLYNGKISTNEEAAEGLNLLKKHIDAIGYEIVTDRGDHPEK